MKSQNIVQPVSSEVVLAGSSSVGQETYWDQWQPCAISQNYRPSSLRSRGCLPTSAVWLEYGLGYCAPRVHSRAKAWLTPHVISEHSWLYPETWNVPPDIVSSLEYALTSWSAIKYIQDKLTAAKLLRWAESGRSVRLAYSYVTHTYKASGRVSD